MANAMVALATLTLSSTQTTVTFSSIPTTGYRDLFLSIQTANSSTASASRLRLNGDTAGNYYGVWMVGNGTNTTSSSSESAQTGARIMGASSGPSTGWSSTQIHIMDASATDKHKAVLSRFSDAATDVQATCSRWASTSAVTSITIYDVLGQTYAVGSTFSLYGIVS